MRPRGRRAGHRCGGPEDPGTALDSWPQQPGTASVLGRAVRGIREKLAQRGGPVGG